MKETRLVDEHEREIFAFSLSYQAFVSVTRHRPERERLAKKNRPTENTCYPAELLETDFGDGVAVRLKR